MAKEVSKSNKKDKKENKSFFKEFKAELKRVSWPTFKQLVNNTSAVLAIVLIVAAIVFILDVIFEDLNNFGVEKLKALVTSSSSESSESLEGVSEDEIEVLPETEGIEEDNDEVIEEEVNNEVAENTTSDAQ